MVSWEDVARIIDVTLEGIAYFGKPPAPAMAPQSDSKAVSSDFGDKNKVPPSPEQVTAYSKAIGYPLDGEGWCDSYNQKGWMVGKTRMKDWQSAVRNWKRSGYTIGKAIAEPTATKDYSKL